MPVPSDALVVPAEQPMDIYTSRDGWSTMTLAVVMTVATLVTMIKMVATCSSCFGKPGNGAAAVSPGDEVIAFEVPGADVGLCSNARPLSLHPPHSPDVVPPPLPLHIHTRPIVPSASRAQSCGS